MHSLSQFTPSRTLTDVTIELMDTDFEIRYQLNGEHRETSYSDIKLVKLLKRSGMITGHRTVGNEFNVIWDGGFEPLRRYIADYCDQERLINQIEKY